MSWPVIAKADTWRDPKKGLGGSKRRGGGHSMDPVSHTVTLSGKIHSFVSS